MIRGVRAKQFDSAQIRRHCLRVMVIVVVNLVELVVGLLPLLPLLLLYFVIVL